MKALILIWSSLLVCNAYCFVSARDWYRRSPQMLYLAFMALHGVLGVMVASILAFNISLWLTTQ